MRVGVFNATSKDTSVQRDHVMSFLMTMDKKLTNGVRGLGNRF